MLVAALFALPFIAVGLAALAYWEDPPTCLVGQTCPTDNNLAGPVWLQPTDTPTEQFGSIKIFLDPNPTINGVPNPAFNKGGWVYADHGSFNAPSGDSLTATNLIGGQAAIAGVGFDNPTQGTGSWAGKFTGAGGGNGYVLADYYCTPGATAGTYNCSGGAAGLGDGLWTQESGTTNIFKGTAADLSGIVAIGTATPSGLSAPGGTKLAVVTASATDPAPRIFVDGRTGTGNPEINLKFGAGDHWALYADKTSPNNLTFWRTSNLLSLTTAGQLLLSTGTAAAPSHSFLSDTNTGLYSGGADTLAFATGGVNRVTLTSEGVAVFAGWAPPSFDFSLALNPTSGSAVPSTAFSLNSTVTVTLVAGATKPVALSGASVPVGPTVSFAPTQVTPTGTSTMTLSSVAGVAAGTYTVTVTGTGSGATHSATYTLNVNPQLTVNKTPTAGAGTISGSVTCGLSCSSVSQGFAAGTTITLTATKSGCNPGFLNWTGAFCNGSTATTCTFTMPTSNVIENANFKSGSTC